MTINTNGKTVTRSGGTITITAGTVTINGSGTIVNTANDGVTFTVTGGTFKTSGTPLLQSDKKWVISASGAAVINPGGGYIYSKANHAISKSGTGALTVTNTYVFCDDGHYNAIRINSGSGATTINGTSVVGSGITNSAAPWPSVAHLSTGSFTLDGSARVIAGEHAAQAVWIEGTNCVVQFKGESQIYMNNSGIKDGIFINSTGVNVTFNSTKWFYSCGASVLSAGDYSLGGLTVTHGQFVCRNYGGQNPNGYMFYSGGGYWTNWSGAGNVGGRWFSYMTDYKTVDSWEFSNCFYYSK